MKPKLLTFGNPKILKGAALGYRSAIMHLAPHTLSGSNFCPYASLGCIFSCLNTSGHGKLTTVQTARVNRSLRFLEDRILFLEDLEKELRALVRTAGKRNQIPCFRPNGTSDKPWERIYPELFQRFSELQFYGYTKDPRRMNSFLHLTNSKGIREPFPRNYHLTFSSSETNDKDCRRVLEAGGNVAVVFQTEKDGGSTVDIGGTVDAFGLKDVPIIDGMENDLRFLDPRHNINGLRIGMGHIVALQALGKARKDRTGFVRTIERGMDGRDRLVSSVAVSRKEVA